MKTKDYFKIIGFVLVVIGFLGGALFSVKETEGVVWQYYILSMIVGVSGLVMIRLAYRSEALASETVDVNMSTLVDTLSKVVKHLSELIQRRDSLNINALPDELDKLFPDDLMSFADARKTLAHLHGLQAYAEVMSPFAAGERYLNRVWSAASDGYAEEAKTYLERAHAQFVDALNKIDAMSGSGEKE
ncbi:MAG: hypothetical protein K9N52_04805 [Verrucomicrobia bacterium]|nr:hypothetical protein [Verrucomicrobiota bacterium]